MPHFEEERREAQNQQADFTPLIVVGALGLAGGFAAFRGLRAISNASKNFTPPKFEKPNLENFTKNATNSESGTNQHANQEFVKNAKQAAKSFTFKSRTFGGKLTEDQNKQMEKDLKKALDEMFKASQDLGKNSANNQKNGKFSFHFGSLDLKNAGKFFDDLIDKAESGKKSGPPTGKSASQDDPDHKKSDANTEKNANPISDFIKEMKKTIDGIKQDIDKELDKETGGLGKKSEKTKQKEEGFTKAPPTSASIKKDDDIAGFFKSIFVSDPHLAGGFEDQSKNGMSMVEARRILQFPPSGPPPRKEQIVENHRVLARANHPDMGGSAFVSAKINEAKDVLIRDSRKRGRR